MNSGVNPKLSFDGVTPPGTRYPMSHPSTLRHQGDDSLHQRSSRGRSYPSSGDNSVKGQVAVVITDPQNDSLSPKGVTCGIVGQSVTENKMVEQEMPTQSEENNQVIQHRYERWAEVHGRPFREYAQRRSTGARSPGLAEYDLHGIHGFGNDSCSHLRDRPGIARFLAKLMVGDML